MTTKDPRGTDPGKIFRAGNIITMGPHAPEALAVQGDKIAAIGSMRDLRDRLPNAECIDLGDAVIVPGLNDGHTHLAGAADHSLAVDLSPDAVSSMAEAKAALRQRAENTEPGDWVRGSRYDDSRFEPFLNRWEIDDAVPDHPVIIRQVSGHWGVANSRALEIAGFTRESEPPAGGEFGRDARGELNGIVFEQAFWNFAHPGAAKHGQTIAPQYALEERLEGLRRAVERFHSAGLTSITDALVGMDDIELFEEGVKRGILTLRVNMLVSYEGFDQVRARAPGSTFGDSDLLRMDGFKFILDGAVGGRTCLMAEPYAGTADDYGLQDVTDEELADIVGAIHHAGHRVCVHANGDRAIEMLLKEIERVQAESAGAPPHRIEHCSVVTEDIIRRMKQLGLIAAPFGSYVSYYGSKLIDWYGEKRPSRMFTHRWFLDAGIPVVGSSDYPCGPLEPLLALQSCVTRRGEDGVEVGADQQITPAEALALYTTAPATVSGEDQIKGRLEPGFFADFTVLGASPLEVEPDALAEIPVLATYVGGQQTWATATAG